MKHNIKNILVFAIIFLFIGASFTPLKTIKSKSDLNIPTVKINIAPYSVLYEGDIINCTISGNPTVKYWYINNQSPHNTFYGDDPIIFDPEPTPLDTKYVNLSVYAENDFGNASSTIQITIKRIYFGDIHWHTTLDDGDFSIDRMYKNAIKDNYLDFVCYTGQAEWIDGIHSWNFSNPNKDIGKTLYSVAYLIWFIRNFITYKILKINEWDLIKKKAIEYYNEGNFTTFLGFEWSQEGPYAFHNNFYYKDVYSDALEYSADMGQLNYKATLDDIYLAMTEEWNNGHYNIGFPHHPHYKQINWTYFANKVNTIYRNQILRGVEIYSLHGNSIGRNFTPNLPYNWPYSFIGNYSYSEQSWVENAMWEWSETNSTKGQKFGMIAGSDIHSQSRPGSAKAEGILRENYYNPSGLIAVYSVHNNRSEIWDSMNLCDMYASQLLKIRSNVRFDGEIAYGRWINCSLPLNITITAQSTFSGLDNSNKSMCPHAYSPNKLNYPIQDIWIIKNDRSKGKPWCKIINYTTPNTNTAVVFFEDYDVQPNDFYWIAIRQKGDYLRPRIIRNPFIPDPDGELVRDEYMVYIGPIFIDNVI